MRRDFKQCLVCGLPLSFYPWGEGGKDPTRVICGCCGTEFGYEDSTLEGIRAQRRRWIDGGAVWFTPMMKPEDWSLEDQLKNIPEELL